MFKVILIIIQSSRFQLYVGMKLVWVLCRWSQITFSSALVREALLKAGGLSKNLFRTSGGACYRLCKNRCRSGNLKNSWKNICHILCLIVDSCHYMMQSTWRQPCLLLDQRLSAILTLVIHGSFPIFKAFGDNSVQYARYMDNVFNYYNILVWYCSNIFSVERWFVEWSQYNTTNQ